MAKSLFYIVLMLLVNFTAAQGLNPTEDLLKEFQEIQAPSDKFNFFFKSINRYVERSAYDWLQEVNVQLNNAQQASDSLAVEQYQLIQAQIHFDLGDYDKSMAIANELNVKREDLALPFKGLLLNLMDTNYERLELYDKQVEIRQVKRDLGITKNIAFYDIYSNLGLHRKAMTDYIMDMKKTLNSGDLFGLADYTNNVGKYLLLDGSASVALSNFKTAKGYVDVYLNDLNKVKTEEEIQRANILKGIIEGNIGKAHVNLNQFQEALPYLENSIGVIKEYNIGRYSEDVIENTLALAQSHLLLENYKKAKDYLDVELNLRKTEHIVKRNRLMSTYYDQIEDYKNATFYLKKNSRIADSININDTSLKKQQLTTIAEYDFANSRKMIDEQKLAMERSRIEIQAQGERINLVFISLIFTLLGFAGLVYAYLKSIKNQRLIAEQKHIIETSLVEKDSLLKEIHHRVKNNLQMVSSLLSLQTKNTRSKAAIEALEEGKTRVKAMALIHQKLYQNDDLSVVEMQSYIESLINSVQSVFKKGGHNINITIDAEGVELDIDRAIPFGLILNELVSNSFKYAFPDDDGVDGKIYIHIRKNGEHGYFEYTDNGIGLPEDSENRASSSMGIRLMNRLVNQLQSTLNIDKTTEGVRFWFNFK